MFADLTQILGRNAWPGQLEYCDQNLLDVCVCTLCWWVAGYALAFGNGGAFIGGGVGGDFFLVGLSSLRGGRRAVEAAAAVADCESDTLSAFLFQLMFASTAVTIVSGAVAQRAKFQAYLLFCAVMSVLIYPAVAHWLWSSDGWLAATAPEASALGGALDFAGGCTVHVVGGVAAVSGAVVFGYRNKFSMDQRRWPPRFAFVAGKGWRVNEYEPASEALASLGVFLLWVGWFSFNAGSIGRAVVATEATPLRMELASLVFVNSLVSPSAAALALVLLGALLKWRRRRREAAERERELERDASGRGGGSGGGGAAVVEAQRRAAARRQYYRRHGHQQRAYASVSDAINGILAGLVVVTPAAGFVQPEVALVLGVLSAFAYKGGSELLLKLRVDDPLDASVVHGVCGALGVLSLGFVADPGLVAVTLPMRSEALGGLFYGGDGTLLAAQAVAVAATAAWTGALSVALFWAMRRFDQNRAQTWFVVMTESTAQRLAFGHEGTNNSKSEDGAAAAAAAARGSELMTLYSPAASTTMALTAVVPGLRVRSIDSLADSSASSSSSSSSRSSRSSRSSPSMSQRSSPQRVRRRAARTRSASALTTTATSAVSLSSDSEDDSENSDSENGDGSSSSSSSGSGSSDENDASEEASGSNDDVAATGRATRRRSSRRRRTSKIVRERRETEERVFVPS